ncbi:MAG: O-methyltransferase [Bacteroidales bacterium]|nr:O-methyltransferase [Bacteroidales bacterium]
MSAEDAVSEYAIQHTSPEDDVLHRLYRETNLTTVYPRMLSGHLQGKLLEFISRMIKPSRILEIGTFTGYSAICLAKGLTPEGVLHTIDINDELSDTALRYFTLAGMESKIFMHCGDARQVIQGLSEMFDLIFIDGDKEQYTDYYELALAKLNIGGFLLADNVLWGGKVTAEIVRTDKEAEGIRAFNELVAKDTRVEKLFLPFRDGLYILQKLTG